MILASARPTQHVQPTVVSLTQPLLYQLNSLASRVPGYDFDRRLPALMTADSQARSRGDIAARLLATHNGLKRVLHSTALYCDGIFALARDTAATALIESRFIL